jgi:hypothetical protein
MTLDQDWELSQETFVDAALPSLQISNTLNGVRTIGASYFGLK